MARSEPLKLYLVRHGESAWNAEGRLQGQADPELSAAGREQAAALAPLLADLEVPTVVVSDLARARETARLAGFADAAPDARWRERSLGEWETFLQREVATPQDMTAFRNGELVPEGGEAWPAFQARVAEALDELTTDALIFTHGGCVRAAVAHITDSDWRAVSGPANTSLTVLESGKRRRMLAFNWTPAVPGQRRPSDP